VSQEEDAQLSAAVEGVKAYRASMEKLSALVAAGAPITERDSAVAGADKPVASALDTIIEMQKAQTAKRSVAINELAAAAKWSVAIVTMIALLAAALLATLITRSIVHPIKEALRVAESVAAGDLTTRITVSRTDEAGRLLTALAAMNESKGQRDSPSNPPFNGIDPYSLNANFGRKHRSVTAHRRTSCRTRTNGCKHGATSGDREAKFVAFRCRESSCVWGLALRKR